jgi:ketosteroid isomerase-like protein
MADGSAEAGIEQAYRDYVAAFNREDSAGVAAVLDYPIMVEGGNSRPTTIADAAGYRQMIERVFAEFKQLGWVRSQIDRLQAFPTAGDTGVLLADFSRWRDDGSLIVAGSGHYVMRKGTGGWRIIAAIAT